MIEDMIYYVVLLFAFIILITDIIAVVTSDVRNAGKFIRRIRFWAYSITPAMYAVMILAVWLIAGIFDFNFVHAMIIILMLAAVCCTAYAEKFFTRKKAKKSDKKRVRTEQREFCGKLGYAEELTPLTEKKG